MNKGLIFGGIVGVGLLVWLWAKGSSVANMVAKLTVSPKLSGAPKFDSNLQLPLAIDFQNRSDQEVRLSVNSVMIYYQDTLIATNKPSANMVVVKANTTSTLKTITMQVPYLKLITLGTAVYEAITNRNFDTLLNNLTVKIGATINNAFVFDLDVKLNDSKDVDASGNVNGLGLVAASERKIKPITDYIAYLPGKSLLKYEDKIVHANGSVVDTANIMRQVAREDAENVKALAEHLAGKTVKETLKNIFDFVYTHIQYELDDRFVEQVRRPLRTLYDQKGDCDCYATLIGSMLEALGIKYKFRIAMYSAGRYQHVYVIVPMGGSGEGQYYTVDPVLDVCFAEKRPVKVIDI